MVLCEGITSIGENAFADNSLQSLVLPEGITSIGENAFADNSLQSLVLPEGITSIGDGAFRFNQLISVDLPEEITSIGGKAFYDNPIASLTLPTGILKGFTDKWRDGNGDDVQESPIYDFKTSYIRISESYTLTDDDVTVVDNVLESYLYNDGGLVPTVIIIPPTLDNQAITGIGEKAFSSYRTQTKLASITLPEGITGIGSQAFSSNQLASVDLSPCSSLTTIGEMAFWDNPLNNITLPADAPGYAWTDRDGQAHPAGSVINDFITSYKIDVVTYNIAYALNGGENHKGNPLGYTVKDLPITLAASGREGHIFGGWYKGTDLATPPVTEIPVGTTGRMVLHAKWTLNEAPTAITLSDNTIPENLPAGTVIGTLSTTDPNENDTHTYVLSGTDTNNFEIESSQLKSKVVFNHEEKATYEVSVTATDRVGDDGLVYTKTLTIEVLDVNDAPVLATEIEKQAAQEDGEYALAIPTSNATDEDGDELTVRVDSLPDGLSYADGRITGTPTETGEHTITVTYSDGSESVTDTFILTVQAEETSTVLTSAPAGESSTIKVYPNPASVQVTIEMNGPVKGYTLTVTDLIGHAVLTIRDLDGLMANNSLTLPVIQLRPGVYFLRFIGKGNSLQTVRKIYVKRRYAQARPQKD